MYINIKTWNMYTQFHINNMKNERVWKIDDLVIFNHIGNVVFVSLWKHLHAMLERLTGRQKVAGSIPRLGLRNRSLSKRD